MLGGVSRGALRGVSEVCVGVSGGMGGDVMYVCSGCIVSHICCWS